MQNHEDFTLKPLHKDFSQLFLKKMWSFKSADLEVHFSSVIKYSIYSIRYLKLIVYLFL